MEVLIKKRAQNVILKTAQFVESKNTEGSGTRWVEKLESLIYELAESKAQFQLCKSPELARWNFSCYSHKGWAIAFRISHNKFEVCRFIWGSNLNY